MKSSLSNWLVLLIIVSMMLTGCADSGLAPAPLDSQVLALQTGSTMWLIRQAIAEKSGTVLMAKNNLVLFMSGMGEGWGFTVVDTAKYSTVKSLQDIGLNGNFVNPKTMGDVVSTMRDNGWKVIGAKELPLAVRGFSAAYGWLAALSQSLVTIVVIPAGAMTDPGKYIKVLDTWQE